MTIDEVLDKILENRLKQVDLATEAYDLMQEGVEKEEIDKRTEQFNALNEEIRTLLKKIDEYENSPVVTEAAKESIEARLDQIEEEVIAYRMAPDYDHNGEKPVLVREVDLSLFSDEVINETNTYIDGIGKCEIEVYEREGDNLPHLHIKSKDEVTINGRKKQFNGCVRLDVPEFFAHGQHRDTFKMLKNSKDVAISFNNFMNSKDKETGKQMWEIYKTTWLKFHPYSEDPKKKNRDVQNLAQMGYKDKPNYNNLV